MCGSSDGEERASSGRGTRTFIAHSALTYNASTNTQYLEDDCLHFRVKEAAVLYSSPSISEFPSWQDSTLPSQSLCEFTLYEFSKRKQFNNEYCSTPFYTHPRGYKMRVVVDSNGKSFHSRGHVSVSVLLLKGEFDNELCWPFEGDVIVEVLNWRQDSQHHMRVINLSEHLTQDPPARVIASSGVGLECYLAQFMAHSAFDHDTTEICYLENDCLWFRVSGVIIYSNGSSPGPVPKVPLWLEATSTLVTTSFTMSNFSTRKLHSHYFESCYFYSDPKYYMTIEIYPAGHGAGKGSHVSVYPVILKGKHDQFLQWPFVGDVDVELLNWSADSHHYKKTLHLTQDSTHHRVSMGDIAATGLDCEQFIAHSVLEDSAFLLHNDCLHFRVNVVVRTHSDQ